MIFGHLLLYQTVAVIGAPVERGLPELREVNRKA